MSDSFISLQRKMTSVTARPFSTNFEVLLTDSKTIEPVTLPQVFERGWNDCVPRLANGVYADRNVFLFLVTLNTKAHNKVAYFLLL